MASATRTTDPGAIAPRPVDHCVLPVSDLDTARARYRALGFTVAGEGLHPFGTKNACVYLADDTFLEPLAIADADVAAGAAAEGNVFVARDAAWRERHGQDGFSAIVMGTQDADADHARFATAGVSAGPRLDFSRAYLDASGTGRTVSFRLAFAAPAMMRETFFFTCERVDAPAGGRGALARHGNGVTCLSRLVACAENPADFSRFLALLTKTEPQAEAGGFIASSANAPISILTPSQARIRYGLAPEPTDGLSLFAVGFTVGNLTRTSALFDAASVRYETKGDTLVVPPAPGQGAVLAFEEKS